MPDHDSVMGHATGLVDRLVGVSDLMVWVLDPQKYADRAVHHRFLVPLAGHSEVIAVVLNQADLLTAAQVEDCLHDLRRLLDSENLHEVQIIVTSAVTGAGIEELRKLLTETVSARRASAARIAADVDQMVVQFRPYSEVTHEVAVAARCLASRPGRQTCWAPNSAGPRACRPSGMAYAAPGSCGRSTTPAGR